MYIATCMCSLLYITQIDLKKLGISGYGNIETQELGRCANNKLELYFNKTVSQCLYTYMHFIPNSVIKPLNQLHTM